MKRHHGYLFVTLFVLFASSVFVAILQAQEPTEDGTTSIYLPFVSDNEPTSGKPQPAYQIPPPPPFPRPEPQGMIQFRTLSGKIPTPTPDPSYPLNLRKRFVPETPPEPPTETEFIDLDPKLDYSSKYEVIIERGNADKELVILVPAGTSKEEEKTIIDKHLHEENGDTYRVGFPPFGPVDFFDEFDSEED